MSIVDPLVYTFTVACGPEHAFTTWTTKIDSWWPKGHSLSGDPDPTIEIEGRVGGRIIEQGNDGTEYEWGRVTQWDPPNKLAYTWFPGTTPDRPTTVELTFSEEEGKTTVQLVSSGWEQFAADGGRYRSNNDQGWTAAVTGFQHYLGVA